MIQTERLHRGRNRRRAMTLAEVMIAVAITAILITIVVPAMVYYARAIKGIRIQQKMQQEANLFIQKLQYELTRSDEVQFISANVVRVKSAENVLVPETETPGLFTYKIYPITMDIEFNPGDDNDPVTIGDNSIKLIRVKKNPQGNIVEETEETVLRWVSPLLDEDGDPLPVFDRQIASKTFSIMQLRVGDRSNPSTEEDDRYTGVGYQGFVFRTVLTPTN